MSAANFVANGTGTPGDTNDFIIFNTSSGALVYDSNGSTAGGTIATFATLTVGGITGGVAAIDATDFVII